MGRTGIIIGTHNHLPLGRGDASAEQLYQDALKPLLAVLYRYPDFPMTLHYSGILMEWLEEAHPEFLALLGEMVSRGQVEVLGGGYYDPILPLLPMNDKLGQLEKMTTWLRVRFETRPRGCWIAEKVWEPSLASVLRASGIDYTFVDDGQFALAGASGGALWQPAIAEDQGKIISLLPISDRLSRLAAASTPAEVIEFLRNLSSSLESPFDSGGISAAASSRSAATPGGIPWHDGGVFISGNPLAIIMDDGASAATALLRDGWLEEFIRRTTENVSWLEPATSGQYLRDHPPTRRLLVPASSSAHIMNWSLPPERREAFARMRGLAGDGDEQFIVGGHFRNFLGRYPEAWLLYAKMMNTHVLVNQVRGDKYKKKAAQNELWKGQCHHAYWHGGAGGIYENELRKATYRALIEAEKITRATEIFAPSIIGIDFDMDGNIEYLYQGSELNAYIHTRGGALFELDFLPASWNYLDTMVDRECIPPGGEGAAGVPSSVYPRKAFIDHFFMSDCSIGDFAAGRPDEAGDFMHGLYELVELNRALPELLMRRDGSVFADGAPRAVRLEKRFVFRPRSIDVYYRVANLGATRLSATFGVEINISLAARSAEHGRLFQLEENRKKEFGSDVEEIEGVGSLLVRDVRNEVSVTLSSAKSFRCWSVPIETPSGAGPREFQSHCFMPLWALELRTGESWENHMSVGFEKTQSA
jgi:alpha-amylase